MLSQESTFNYVDVKSPTMNSAAALRHYWSGHSDATNKCYKSDVTKIEALRQGVRRSKEVKRRSDYLCDEEEKRPLWK